MTKDEEIAYLKRKVKDLEKRLSDYSWQINPDRSGGQFDYQDYEQAERDRQGIF